MTGLLDAATVKAELLAICREMPDAVNPKQERPGRSPVCLYSDPNDLTRHCLIGEYASRKGWRLPPLNIGAFAAVDQCEWPLNTLAAALLADAQECADGGPIFGNPLPWGEVAPLIEAL